MYDMKSIFSFLLFFMLLFPVSAQKKSDIFAKGRLVVSDEGRYLKFTNGEPFFWLGETGWLLPERLDRAEASYYLNQCSLRGYNVVQVQTVDGIPAYNYYGKSSMPDGFDFSKIDKEPGYGYWDHMDYIVETAARNGIFIGMVCVWGTPVSAGQMNVGQAEKYGRFLAERYRKYANIIWIIGGDIRGDVKTEVWEALARTIRKYDPDHLMTFHPRGRTTSAVWFNEAEWLDFNMFQSGHRRYGQRKGDGDYPIEENTEEDNWRFVERSQALSPLKPVIDAEPIYEDIPHGLHEAGEARWNANDVRRYAYWSVFAGSFGHTYGHNSIMQFYKPGVAGSFFPSKYWYDCMNEPGFNQMQYLKELMLRFPFFERVPDQSVVAGVNGERYDRVVATRGTDYLLAYNYSGRPMQLDLSKIGGSTKECWWFVPSTGKYEYIGRFEGTKVQVFQADVPYMAGHDRVLVAYDSSKKYLP